MYFTNQFIRIIVPILMSSYTAQAEDYITGNFFTDKPPVQTKSQLIEQYGKSHAPGLAFPFPEGDYQTSTKTWKELMPHSCIVLSKGYAEMLSPSEVCLYLLDGDTAIYGQIYYASRPEMFKAWWFLHTREWSQFPADVDPFLLKGMTFFEDKNGFGWLLAPRKNRQNKLLAAYSCRNFLFNFTSGQFQFYRKITDDELKRMLNEFLDIQQGLKPAVDGKKALKQAKKDAEKRSIRNSTIEIDRAVTYGLRSSVPFLRCGSSVRLRNALKIPEEPMVNTIPNINAGVACGDIVDKLATGKLKVMKTSGAEDGFKATLGSRSERIHYTIVHQFNRNLAINTVLDFRALDHMLHRWDHKVQTDQDVIKYSIINPGWVGDFDIATKARLGRDGAVVFGSEKSAIYFTRGNTAVSIVSENPYFNVLPMARLVDEELKKKLNIPPAKDPIQQPPSPQKRQPPSTTANTSKTASASSPPGGMQATPST